VQELAGDPEIALRWATEQGEEFELLASIPPERVAGAAAAVAAGGYRVTEIGRVTEGAGAAMIDREGRERAPAGFDHRRGSLGSS